MMKCIYFLLAMLLALNRYASAQELYVFSEPASNMPAKSIGIRITNELISKGDGMNRTMPEVMFSFNKSIMTHVQGFFSDVDGRYRAEGGSIYVKYRFLSEDAVRRHFRAAVFGRLSTSRRAVYSEDINLEGDNTGAQAGIVVTQLLHKLALSGTLAYTKAFNAESSSVSGMARPDQLIGYGISSGYLVLPFVYKGYNQPNFNFYFEALGKTNPANGRSYLDFAPALQVILKSRTRIDFGYRFQVAGGMEGRYNKNMYLLRAEFNFFNVLK